MAKIAVIFVLIALCSVVMSSRITREEPNPFDPLVATLKQLGEAAKNFIQDPKTQKLVKDVEEDGQKLLKDGGEQAEKLLGELKVKVEELTKDGEGNFKKIADTVNQSVQDLINKNKKN